MNPRNTPYDIAAHTGPPSSESTYDAFDAAPVLVARLLAVMPAESTIDRAEQAAAIAAEVARATARPELLGRPSAGLEATGAGSG